MRESYTRKVLDVFLKNDIEGKTANQIVAISQLVDLLEAEHDQAFDNGIGAGHEHAVEGFIEAIRNSKFMTVEAVTAFIEEQGWS